MSILQPEKVARPLLAATGLVVQVSVPPLGFVAMARVTLLVLPVTVLPY